MKMSDVNGIVQLNILKTNDNMHLFTGQSYKISCTNFSMKIKGIWL